MVISNPNREERKIEDTVRKLHKLDPTHVPSARKLLKDMSKKLPQRECALCGGVDETHQPVLLEVCRVCVLQMRKDRGNKLTYLKGHSNIFGQHCPACRKTAYYFYPVNFYACLKCLAHHAKKAPEDDKRLKEGLKSTFKTQVPQYLQHLRKKLTP